MGKKGSRRKIQWRTLSIEDNISFVSSTSSRVTEDYASSTKDESIRKFSSNYYPQRKPNRSNIEGQRQENRDSSTTGRDFNRNSSERNSSSSSNFKYNASSQYRFNGSGNPRRSLFPQRRNGTGGGRAEGGNNNGSYRYYSLYWDGRSNRHRQPPSPHSLSAASSYINKENDDNPTSTPNLLAKPQFNEDEYTRITTPRQDVIFKKGYLSQPKRYLSSTDTNTTSSAAGSVISSAEESVSGTSVPFSISPEQCSSNADSIDPEHPMMYSYFDQNGVFYVSPFIPNGYDQYTGQMIMLPYPTYTPYLYPSETISPPLSTDIEEPISPQENEILQEDKEMKSIVSENSVKEDETTSSVKEDETTSSVKEDETTSSVKEDETTSSVKEDETTSSVKEDETTSSVKEDETTSSVKEDETTSSVKEDETASSVKEDETTSSVQESTPPAADDDTSHISEETKKEKDESEEVVKPQTEKEDEINEDGNSKEDSNKPPEEAENYFNYEYQQQQHPFYSPPVFYPYVYGTPFIPIIGSEYDTYNEFFEQTSGKSHRFRKKYQNRFNNIQDTPINATSTEYSEDESGQNYLNRSIEDGDNSSNTAITENNTTSESSDLPSNENEHQKSITFNVNVEEFVPRAVKSNLNVHVKEFLPKSFCNGHTDFEAESRTDKNVNSIKEEEKTSYADFGTENISAKQIESRAKNEFSTSTSLENEDSPRVRNEKKGISTANSESIPTVKATQKQPTMAERIKQSLVSESLKSGPTFSSNATIATALKSEKVSPSKTNLTMKNRAPRSRNSKEIKKKPKNSEIIQKDQLTKSPPSYAQMVSNGQKTRNKKQDASDSSSTNFSSTPFASDSSSSILDTAVFSNADNLLNTVDQLEEKTVLQNTNSNSLQDAWHTVKPKGKRSKIQKEMIMQKEDEFVNQSEDEDNETPITRNQRSPLIQEQETKRSDNSTENKEANGKNKSKEMAQIESSTLTKKDEKGLEKNILENNVNETVTTDNDPTIIQPNSSNKMNKIDKKYNVNKKTSAKKVIKQENNVSKKSPRKKTELKEEVSANISKRKLKEQDALKAIDTKEKSSEVEKSNVIFLSSKHSSPLQSTTDNDLTTLSSLYSLNKKDCLIGKNFVHNPLDILNGFDLKYKEKQILKEEEEMVLNVIKSISTTHHSAKTPDEQNRTCASNENTKELEENESIIELEKNESTQEEDAEDHCYADEDISLLNESSHKYSLSSALNEEENCCTGEVQDDDENTVIPINDDDFDSGTSLSEKTSLDLSTSDLSLDNCEERSNNLQTQSDPKEDNISDNYENQSIKTNYKAEENLINNESGMGSPDTINGTYEETDIVFLQTNDKNIINTNAQEYIELAGNKTNPISGENNHHNDVVCLSNISVNQSSTSIEKLDNLIIEKNELNHQATHTLTATSSCLKENHLLENLKDRADLNVNVPEDSLNTQSVQEENNVDSTKQEDNSVHITLKEQLQELQNQLKKFDSIGSLSSREDNSRSCNRTTSDFYELSSSKDDETNDTTSNSKNGNEKFSSPRDVDIDSDKNRPIKTSTPKFPCSNFEVTKENNIPTKFPLTAAVKQWLDEEVKEKTPESILRIPSDPNLNFLIRSSISQTQRTLEADTDDDDWTSSDGESETSNDGNGDGISARNPKNLKSNPLCASFVNKKRKAGKCHQTFSNNIDSDDSDYNSDSNSHLQQNINNKTNENNDNACERVAKKKPSSDIHENGGSNSDLLDYWDDEFCRNPKKWLGNNSTIPASASDRGRSQSSSESITPYESVYGKSIDYNHLLADDYHILSNNIIHFNDTNDNTKNTKKLDMHNHRKCTLLENGNPESDKDRNIGKNCVKPPEVCCTLM